MGFCFVFSIKLDSIKPHPLGHAGDQGSRHLGPVQQQDLAVDHAVSDHAPEHGRLRPRRADAVGTRVHQGLLVDVVEVGQRLVHLLPQLPRVSVELGGLHLQGGGGGGGKGILRYGGI